MTWLPYADFDKCARVLDDRRLSAQRTENIKLLQQLTGKELVTSYPEMVWGNLKQVALPRKDWEVRDHPVSWPSGPCKRMWVGFEYLFMEYQCSITQEWTAERGNQDTTWEKFMFLWNSVYVDEPDQYRPKWLGDNIFHLSMQAELVRRDPARYEDIFPGSEGGVVWPS